MRRIVYPALLILFALICEPGRLNAQNGSELVKNILERDQLSGKWFGYRGDMEAIGLSPDVSMLSDFMYNAEGGISKKGAWIENLTFSLVIDTDKMIGTNGTNMLISAIQNNGGSLSQYTGDVQGVNNAEGPKTMRLFEGWIQQKLFKNRLSLLAGWYDINTEFDFISSASVFLQSSQGMGGDFAGSGFIGPATFPAPGLTARLKWVPSPQFYLQALTSDGNPGSESGGVTSVNASLSNNGGFLYMGEVGFLSFNETFQGSDNESGVDSEREMRRHVGRTIAGTYKSKISVGFWMYSKNYLAERYGEPSLEAAGIKDRSSYDKGIYVLSDIGYKPEFLKSYQSLHFFFRMGITDNEVSRFKTYIGGGITYKGVFEDDPNGVLGISIASVQDSKVYQRLRSPVDTYEAAVEVTYLTNVIPWLNVQPNVHYIINPGSGQVKLDNAWVIGLRTEITL